MPETHFPPEPTSTHRPIGLFDSGVGGLSVLRVLRRRLPAAALLYVGDVAHAPYGDRAPHDVVDRSVRIAGWLIGHGARIVVVPCNTATALAIDALRCRWPEVEFVGVEPGVKPAVARTRTGRIAVMATTATTTSARLRRLIARHAGGVHVHLQACPGLADAVERGLLEGPQLMDLLRPYCDAVRAAEVDTVVLGCTHYPFVADSIQALLGEGTVLIDTAEAVAERTSALWSDAPERPVTVRGTVRVLSTGSQATLQQLLGQCAGLAHVEVGKLDLRAPPTVWDTLRHASVAKLVDARDLKEI